MHTLVEKWWSNETGKLFASMSCGILQKYKDQKHRPNIENSGWRYLSMIWNCLFCVFHFSFTFPCCLLCVRKITSFTFFIYKLYVLIGAVEDDWNQTLNFFLIHPIIAGLVSYLCFVKLYIIYTIRPAYSWTFHFSARILCNFVLFCFSAHGI